MRVISKVLTGSLIAGAALALKSGEEVAVFHHPCGKREVANPSDNRGTCRDCEAMFAARSA